MRYRSWSVLNPSPMETIEVGNRHEPLNGIIRILRGDNPAREVIAQPATIGQKTLRNQIVSKLPRHEVVVVREIFYSLREAQIVIESWRRHYNTIRPHASLGFKSPAPEVFVPAFAAWPAALRRAATPATLAKRPTLN